MKWLLAAILVLALCLLSMAPAVAAAPAPGVPTDFTAERQGTRILLSWEPPMDGAAVLHYNVYRGTAPDQLEFYDDVDANFTGGYDTEVLRGTTYFYAISANGTDGEGLLSATVEVPPPSDDYPVLVMAIVLSVVVITLLFAFWKGRSGE